MAIVDQGQAVLAQDGIGIDAEEPAHDLAVRGLSLVVQVDPVAVDLAQEEEGVVVERLEADSAVEANLDFRETVVLNLRRRCWI